MFNIGKGQPASLHEVIGWLDVPVRGSDSMELPKLVSHGTVIPRGLCGSGEIKPLCLLSSAGRFLPWLKLSKRELSPSSAFHCAVICTCVSRFLWLGQLALVCAILECVNDTVGELMSFACVCFFFLLWRILQQGCVHTNLIAFFFSVMLYFIEMFTVGCRSRTLYCLGCPQIFETRLGTLIAVLFVVPAPCPLPIIRFRVKYRYLCGKVCPSRLVEPFTAI